MALFGLNLFNKAKPAEDKKVLSVDQLPDYKAFAGGDTYGWDSSAFDGAKFPGGYGYTSQLQTLDYWTLRARSEELFNQNLYARGLIRRLITNELGGAGLTPECSPDASILDLSDDFVNEWAETVESRWNVWSKAIKVCDFREAKSFGAIQRDARQEALISGDVLVVLRQGENSKLPKVQLVSGSRVKTPWNAESALRDVDIRHGVELDEKGRKVAFWIEKDDGDFERLEANSKKTGRRMAWLVYGTDKRMDDVRGQPLLSIILQSLKEIDRYRDAAQRKAVINSMLAMFIKKDVDKMGSLPIQGAATRNAEVVISDDQGSKNYNISRMLPGTVLDELQQGETPVGFSSNGTDIDFPAFESAVLEAIAWSSEVPGEILKLAFSNNYSASQAAINEFKIYLNKIWVSFGEEFCQPIFSDWLISEVLLGEISAVGFLDAYRDPSIWDVLGAWSSCQWYGSIKPSTDQLKQAKGSKMLVDEGWSTNAREARINTGTKFIRNIKKLKYENELKAEAMRPLLELEQSVMVEEPKQFEAERDIAEEDQANGKN